MGPFKAVAACYVRMFNFSGRARRAEYWWFFVWQTLVWTVVGGFYGFKAAQRIQTDPAFAAVMQNPDAAEAYIISVMQPYALPLSIGYLFFAALPNLSVTVRRLHDTDRSGWNIFMPTLVSIASYVVGALFLVTSAMAQSGGGMVLAIFLMSIPTLVASIWFLVWLCLPGTNGDNRFGGDTVPGRKQKAPAHPAFASELQGEQRDRAEVARRAAARDYYKRHVLPSIQKA